MKISKKDQARRELILEGLGRPTKRGLKPCPKCGQKNGLRGLVCKNKDCNFQLKTALVFENSLASKYQLYCLFEVERLVVVKSLFNDNPHSMDRKSSWGIVIIPEKSPPSCFMPDCQNSDLKVNNKEQEIFFGSNEKKLSDYVNILVKNKLLKRNKNLKLSKKNTLAPSSNSKNIFIPSTSKDPPKPAIYNIKNVHYSNQVTFCDHVSLVIHHISTFHLIPPHSVSSYPPQSSQLISFIPSSSYISSPPMSASPPPTSSSATSNLPSITRPLSQMLSLPSQPSSSLSLLPTTSSPSSSSLCYSNVMMLSMSERLLDLIYMPLQMKINLFKLKQANQASNKQPAEAAQQLHGLVWLLDDDVYVVKGMSDDDHAIPYSVMFIRNKNNKNSSNLTDHFKSDSVDDISDCKSYNGEGAMNKDTVDMGRGDAYNNDTIITEDVDINEDGNNDTEINNNFTSNNNNNNDDDDDYCLVCWCGRRMDLQYFENPDRAPCLFLFILLLTLSSNLKHFTKCKKILKAMDEYYKRIQLFEDSRETNPTFSQSFIPNNINNNNSNKNKNINNKNRNNNNSDNGNNTDDTNGQLDLLQYVVNLANLTNHDHDDDVNDGEVVHEDITVMNDDNNNAGIMIKDGGTCGNRVSMAETKKESSISKDNLFDFNLSFSINDQNNNNTNNINLTCGIPNDRDHASSSDTSLKHTSLNVNNFISTPTQAVNNTTTSPQHRDIITTPTHYTALIISPGPDFTQQSAVESESNEVLMQHTPFIDPKEVLDVIDAPKEDSSLSFKEWSCYVFHKITSQASASDTWSRKSLSFQCPHRFFNLLLQKTVNDHHHHHSTHIPHYLDDTISNDNNVLKISSISTAQKFFDKVTFVKDTELKIDMEHPMEMKWVSDGNTGFGEVVFTFYVRSFDALSCLH